jgi:tetrahydromethanopterin S-methyltransferase subunit G
MTLKEAHDFFESLSNQTSNKAEKKLFQRFIYLFSALKSRDLSKEEIQSIETELDSLDLKSIQSSEIKHFKKALNKFEKYLKDAFSLISKGYYTSLGVGLGSSFGILFGIVFLSNMERSMGITTGLTFGMVIGLIIGGTLENKAKSEGKML